MDCISVLRDIDTTNKSHSGYVATNTRKKNSHTVVNAVESGSESDDDIVVPEDRTSVTPKMVAKVPGKKVPSSIKSPDTISLSKCDEKDSLINNQLFTLLNNVPSSQNATNNVPFNSL